MNDRLQVLMGRLNTGWLLCERESDPVKRAHLEDHWIALLREYEAVCDAVGAMDGFGYPMTARKPHDVEGIAA